MTFNPVTLILIIALGIIGLGVVLEESLRWQR